MTGQCFKSALFEEELGRCLNKKPKTSTFTQFLFLYDLILPPPTSIPLEIIQAIRTANGLLSTTFLLTIVMFTFKEKKH